MPTEGPGLTPLCRQECVRRRAVLSVRANPACPDQATAERAVNEVWESCFSDTRPFDEVIRRAGCTPFTLDADEDSAADILDGALLERAGLLQR